MTTYTSYILTSLRYHQTVHNIHQTHLDQLDMLAQKYLKAWLKIPANGCTSQGMFKPYLLGVRPASTPYQEAHVSSYINSLNFHEHGEFSYAAEGECCGAQENTQRFEVPEGWAVSGMHGRICDKSRITALGFVLIKTN